MQIDRAKIPIGLHKVIFLLFIFLSLDACSTRDRIDGYIYYRLNSNPTTLDPALVVDVTGGLITAKLFNGLIRLDDSLNIVPDIAEKWEISDSGNSYLFHLRKGVKFSNNREVTASDIMFSFKRILDPKTKSPNTWVLDKIAGAKEYMEGRADHVAGIEVIDRYSIRVRLNKPFSPFLNLLTMTAAYIVPMEEVKRAGGNFSSHPIGTGPFILKEWQHNNALVLARNFDYFEDKAKAGGVVYRIIPEDLTAVTEFELGNIDVLTVPASDYSKYRDARQWRGLMTSERSLNTYYLGFNCSRPPFNDVNMRKAVARAVDRAKILKSFYEARGRLAKGPVPDILRDWTINEKNGYDPENARRMIRAANGYKRDINFYITSDQEVVDIAEIIQSYLRQAGLNIRIKQLEWSAYKEALNNGEADMFWIGWWADYPDPENFLFPLFHSSNHGASGNRTRYTNKEVDRLIEAGQREIDPKKRDLYYMNAENFIVDDSPCVFFWHKTDFVLRQPGLKNFRMYPIYSMDKGTETSF